MAFQPGDVINIAKVAWDVYNYGWTSELRASTQYAAFGAELCHLSQNLNILASVVHKAQDSLKSHGVRDTSQIRWDPASLVDIVGDFKATLRECHQLLRDNERYGNGGDNPIRSIEWNVLVQPTVDRLRPRIQMHSARMQTVLKPFEIDLLTRIHQDLAQRIGAVHDDVRQVHSDLRDLIGVLVPNLKTALDQQDALHIRLLPVPPEVDRELETVFRLHPVWLDGQFPPLRDMADAFIMSLDKSTRNFKPGLTVDERKPPRPQYLSLLKCLFLMKKMKESEELEAARAPPSLSHWPSYVKELEEKLSHECDEFSRGMIAPTISPVDLDADTLGFWVEEEPGDLIDTVTTKVMMEELMEVPLFSNSRNVSKRIRLMRHAGSHDKRYRLVISATERQTNTRSRQQKEVVDFDVTTAKLNPVYALSGAHNKPFEMILEANNKIHRLGFCTLDAVFLFQQAVTGFKVVDNYIEDRVKASFVIEGQGGSILEDASIQLWIQRRLGGSPVTDASDSPSSIDTPPSPIPISAAPRTMSPTFSYDDFGSPHHIDGADGAAADFGQMSLSSSPGKMSTRLDPLSRSPITPPSASSARFPGSPPRSQTLATSNPLGISPGRDSTRSSSFISKFTKKKPKDQPHPSTRTLSVSSHATTATSATAQTTSSSASDTTVTVHGTGAPKTAVIHNMPLKPMLVLLTHDAKTSRRAVVVLSIDEKTTPNPQRCWCQQAASPDGGPCKITALEQAEGAKPLEARRLHCQSGQWDLLPLSVGRRKEARGFGGADWRGLNRMSILFPDADARFLFGGGFCLCRPRTEGDVLECMKKGHVGLLGQVRVHHRSQAKKWYNGRYGASVHVSHLSLTGGPGDLFWKGP